MEYALYYLPSVVHSYDKSESFAALTRLFPDSCQLVNKKYIYLSFIIYAIPQVNAVIQYQKLRSLMPYFDLISRFKQKKS